jgi:PTH1 family peptidyl-tRNA hydrolase
MKLVVGLGNPGSQYAKTRHNIGFMIAEELAHTQGAKWKSDKKMQAEMTEFSLNGEKIILAKPQTFMNLSGESIQKIMQFYKISPNDVWVVFDDVDVPFGKLKLRQEGSAGGHNGVKSTISCIGQDFIRVRIGISLNDRAVEPSEVYVLKPFKPEEQKELPFITSVAASYILDKISADEIIEESSSLLG